MATNLAQKWRSKRFVSISYRLLAYILLVSSFVTLVITAIQLFIDYRKDINYIEEQIHQIEESYLPSIAASLWEVDIDKLKVLLNGILTLRDIQHLSIQDKVGETVATAGEKNQTSLSKSILQIWYKPPYEDRDELIGQLLVTVTMEGVYQRLKERVLLILSTQAVKTFIVSVFILLIIQRLISRHLKTLGNFARDLNLTMLDTPLSLDRRTGSKKPLDELDLVVKALNQMQSVLKQSLEELKTKARMEGELSAAAHLQESLLPKHPPGLNGYEVTSLFMPARVMSGDYFDFIEIDQRYTGMTVADASGKGMAAAIHANTARALMRNNSHLHHNPVALFCRLNEGLQGDFPANRFLTMGYLLLDMESNSVTWVSAGHEPLIHIDSESGTIQTVKPKGYPFCSLYGENFDSRIQSVGLTVRTGDLLILYSDGLTDIVGTDGEMLGEEGFHEVIQNYHQLSVNEITDKIRQKILAFQDSEDQHDDITLIVLKRL